MTAQPIRCDWCGSDPLYVRYHDEEWGVPLHDERALFELLILEGAQAGLSWLTVLKKRENYRRAFHDFDAQRIASYDDSDVARLMADTGIVRNRAKIVATIGNARAVLQLRDREGGLDHWLWNFVDGEPIIHRWQSQDQCPTRTALSDRISSALRQRGFKFVGSTIVYAYMQATGMVNDHLVACHRHPRLSA